MCGGGAPDNSAQQAYQNQQQVEAQQQMAAASLAQSRQIAQAQSDQNQQAFDYQRGVDDRTLQDSKDQAGRQAAWDQSRGQHAAAATQQINDAFAKFSPDYFRQYAADYTAKADDEISRQYGFAQKNLAFGLARNGTLASSDAAEEQGKLIETRGRAEVDQSTAAQDAATKLQQQTVQSKNALTQQALSSDVLGSPIAAGNDASISANIDTANRAVTGVSDNARNYAVSFQPVSPSLGTLSGIFSGAATGAANVVSGQQDARIASAAYGGTGVSATGLGRSSLRYF
jgi:hypothetical protein